MAEDAPRPDADGRAEAERRARLASVFGDVLPEQTSDDLRGSEGGADPSADGGTSDAWLRREVPPHHGS